MSLSGAWLESLLFPKRCMLCRKFLTRDELDLCRACRLSAPEYPFGAANPDSTGKNPSQFLDSFTAVWYYEGDVRRSLLRYKFHRATHLAGKFGTLLAMRLLDFTLLVAKNPMEILIRGHTTLGTPGERSAG